MPTTVTDAEHTRAVLHDRRLRAAWYGLFLRFAALGGVVTLITCVVVAETGGKDEDVLAYSLVPAGLLGLVALFLAVLAHGRRLRHLAVVELARFALERDFRFDDRLDPDERAQLHPLRLIGVGHRHQLSDVLQGEALGHRLWAFRLTAEYPLTSSATNPRTGEPLDTAKATFAVVAIDGLAVRPPAFRLLTKSVKPTARNALIDGAPRVAEVPGLGSNFVLVSRDAAFLREWLPCDFVAACRCELGLSVEACGDLLAVFGKVNAHDPGAIERLLEHALWLADLLARKAT